jgi:hypothetical protein
MKPGVSVKSRLSERSAKIQARHLRAGIRAKDVPRHDADRHVFGVINMIMSPATDGSEPVRLV